jgi:ribosome-associated toxin RatA of RatAB toxin-antitoxin module
LKELHGRATETVSAPPEECLALLAAVDRYPLWHPDVVREVDVLGRDARGQPTTVRTKLHVAYGRLAHDFDLVLAVTVEAPATIKLARDEGSERFELTWHVRQDRDTRIELDLYANLGVPRFLPLDGVGNALAQEFVTAAKTALSDR